MNIGQFMDWNTLIYTYKNVYASIILCTFAYIKMRFGGIKLCENKFHRLAVALTFHQYCICQDAVGRLEKKSISTLRH